MKEGVVPSGRVQVLRGVQGKTPLIFSNPTGRQEREFWGRTIVVAVPNMKGKSWGIDSENTLSRELLLT